MNQISEDLCLFANVAGTWRPLSPRERVDGFDVLEENISRVLLLFSQQADTELKQSRITFSDQSSLKQQNIIIANTFKLPNNLNCAF